MYEEDNRGRNIGLIVLGVVFVLALGGIVLFNSRRPAGIKPPTAFRPYTAPDKSFAGKVPEDWERVSSGGMGIMSGVTVTHGGAKIAIMSDLMGSLMGDMARSSNQSMSGLGEDLPPGMKMPALPPPKPPVEQVHLQDKGRVAGDYEDFSDGKMNQFTSPLGDARVSEWTASEKGPFGMGSTKIHGYRATILGNERRVSVVCKCSETDWPGLKPAFWTVITSLANGGG